MVVKEECCKLLLMKARFAKVAFSRKVAKKGADTLLATCGYVLLDTVDSVY